MGQFFQFPSITKISLHKNDTVMILIWKPHLYCEYNPYVKSLIINFSEITKSNPPPPTPQNKYVNNAKEFRQNSKL